MREIPAPLVAAHYRTLVQLKLYGVITRTYCGCELCREFWRLGAYRRRELFPVRRDFVTDRRRAG